MSATPLSCLEVFENALSRRDLERAIAVLSDDAVFLYSNGSAHFGKDAIRAAIKTNFDTIKDDTYATHDKVWLSQDVDFAACVFGFAWEGIVDGKKVGGRGRGTTVLRRDPGGWRIVHEHLSPGRWKAKKA